MSYTDMKVAPPIVTGIEIPPDIGIQKTNKYKELKNIRKQVADEFCYEKKLFKEKKKHKVSTFVKILASIATAAALIFGGIKIAGKFKKA